MLTGCASQSQQPAPAAIAHSASTSAFVMRDGAKLPFRAWLPAGTAEVVVLALHGFNDSRDAWEIPAPGFAAAGIAVYAPDQRGFGEAPGRSFWPGAQTLIDDAADMAAALRTRHPGARLILMGESMGGAVLMLLATSAQRPAVDGYVLIAPAVWGRAHMNPFLRAGLWLASTLAPGMEVSNPPRTVVLHATDNPEALYRLSNDPLTISATRVDTASGLVDLMDAALAAAGSFTAPALFLYGARDEIIPADATRTAWSAVRSGRFALYPNGWHLLLRDLDRAAPIGDAIAWIHNPAGRLPSGAETAAENWLTAIS